MKKYADLDLKKIRDDCGLDFARHTYNRGQCSCCYGPKDMKKGWAKGKKPKKIVAKRDSNGKPVTYAWDRESDNYTYILFENAGNGSGRIKSLEEPVMDHTQIGPHYLVKEPEDDFYCICIYYGNVYSVKEVLEMIKENNPRLRKGYWYYFNNIEPKEIVKFDTTLRKRFDEDIIHFI